jgi:hypothetical protein
MTFEELCELEPGLLTLYRRAKGVKDDRRKRSFCANAVWYGRFKPVLCRLVGWEARNPTLRTSEAYDLAYDTIYAALPDCRNCFCL